MVFRSYSPGPPLSAFVENFWLYRGYSSLYLRERIFPTGTFEIVFNLKNDELRIYKASDADAYARFSGAIVSGPYTGFFVTDSAEEASVMGVHFKPGGAFPFLGFAADEFANTHVDLSDVWGAAAGEIRDRLFHARIPERRFRVLEKALLSRLLRRLEHHPAVSLALMRFNADGARTMVRRLAREAGLSDRRFIDVFRAEVGLKPKVFARIRRFQNVLPIVHQTSPPDWGQLAVQHGYFDQSHLIRDFVAFSGFSPADYLARLGDLRSNSQQVKFNHLPLSR